MATISRPLASEPLAHECGDVFRVAILEDARRWDYRGGPVARLLIRHPAGAPRQVRDRICEQVHLGAAPCNKGGQKHVVLTAGFIPAEA